VASFPLDRFGETILNEAENKVAPFRTKSRFATLRDSSEAENGEPQLQNKRGNYTFWRESQ